MKPFVCPGCKKTQNDVWIREGRYLNDNLAKHSWIEYRCPDDDCNEELDYDFLVENRVF